MADLATLTGKVEAFRDERDWKQFHDPKDMAISLALEAGEVLELYQWKRSDAIDKARLGEELADVLYWVLLMARDCGVDLSAALDAKLAENARKYPVEKAKGRAAKWTEL